MGQNLVSLPTPQFNSPDHTLNAALEHTDISQSFEVYRDILERFYR
jgi:hypothetical protein